MKIVVDTLDGTELELPWYLTPTQVDGYIHRKYGIQDSGVYHEWHVTEDDSPSGTPDVVVPEHTHDEDTGEVE